MISLRQLEKLAIDNSPVILTVVGVVGTISTAGLAARGARRHFEFESVNDVAADHKQRLKESYKFYLPAVATGVVTCAAVVGANRIGTRRTAALAAAYTVVERGYSEYRDKVIERFGEDKHRAVRDEIAQDRVNRTPGSKEIVIVGTDVLCFDEFTGRYFKSDMQSIRQAEIDTNRELLNTGYQTLSDFYDRVGLPATDASEEVGWSVDKKLEVEYSTTLSEDGRPCLSIHFSPGPSREYRNFH